MRPARATLLLVLSLGLAACGDEPVRPSPALPAEPLPPPPAPSAPDGEAPAPRIEDGPLRVPPRPPSRWPHVLYAPYEPPPVLAPPEPERRLAPAAPLAPDEAALVGRYRLREFIAMSGQVPGEDARLEGTLELARGRRVTLTVLRHRLHKPLGPSQTYAGGGRWRLSGAEVTFEPFEVDHAVARWKPPEPLVVAFADEQGPPVQRNVPQAGPWVARWKVVREGDQVLLRAGEFTYERTSGP